MVDYITAFREDLDVADLKLRRITDAEASEPRAPGKWSPKQILGHLIDSASVNHERFVRARQLEDLVFPGYDQDALVEAQRYAEAPWNDLIELWTRYNRQLVRVFEATPQEERCRDRAHHNFDEIAFRAVSADLPSTRDYLMKDYVGHLEHHLTQILGDRWAFGDGDIGAPTGRLVLRSERLELRELTPSDLPFVAELIGDAETMRYSPHQFMPTEARFWLHRQFDRYARDGHGLWLMVILISSLQSVGTDSVMIDSGRAT